jgi:hypothetical protein
MCFDLNGKFKFIIDKIGKGPGEYMFLNDFYSTGDVIMVLDNQQKKIISYSSEDGTYISEQKYDFADVSYFAALDNKHYAFFTNYAFNNSHMLYMVDEKFIPYSEFLPMVSHWDGLKVSVPKIYY